MALGLPVSLPRGSGNKLPPQPEKAAPPPGLEAQQCAAGLLPQRQGEVSTYARTASALRFRFSRCSLTLIPFPTSLQLADFGLAKLYHSVSFSKKDRPEGGTTPYMPPEAFNTSYKPKQASDIYRYQST